MSPSNSCLGNQRRHRIDDDHIHGIGLDQQFGDLHRFFAGGRLADQQRVQFDAQLLGPDGVKGVFGVDDRRDAARFLGLGRDVQGQRRLAAGFRAEDLDDPSARNALAAQGDVQRQAARGNARDRPASIGPQGHNRPLAELLLNLLQGCPQIDVVLEHGLHFAGGADAFLGGFFVLCGFL